MYRDRGMVLPVELLHKVAKSDHNFQAKEVVLVDVQYLDGLLDCANYLLLIESQQNLSYGLRQQQCVLGVWRDSHNNSAFLLSLESDSAAQTSQLQSRNDRIPQVHKQLPTNSSLQKPQKVLAPSRANLRRSFSVRAKSVRVDSDPSIGNCKQLLRRHFLTKTADNVVSQRHEGRDEFERTVPVRGPPKRNRVQRGERRLRRSAC